MKNRDALFLWIEFGSLRRPFSPDEQIGACPIQPGAQPGGRVAADGHQVAAEVDAEEGHHASCRQFHHAAEHGDHGIPAALEAIDWSIPVLF